MSNPTPSASETQSIAQPIRVKPEPPKNHGPKNKKIYVRSVRGIYERFRQVFGFILLALFAVLPWLSYQGEQAILLDIFAQRFHIFGLTLWPQDLTLLAYVLIVSAFALFFVTTFAGRVWCGFMCPQTTWVYLFIWCEEKFEGNRSKRIKLDERPMDTDKFFRKAGKHLSWVIISLLTGMTFVGYFTPIDQLFIEFFTFSLGGYALFSVLFFAACTYGNAGYMREIMCTHMCPYARFQSAMFDKDTLTVSYDRSRGESRGPRPRKWDQAQVRERGLGDCIDCNLCVQVCPTGIDIRDGLQYECINCGACVDACDGVMEKMGYDKKLISFTSENRLNGQVTKILRPKLLGYAAVLTVMVSLLIMDVMTRVPIALDIIRDRNTLYRETNSGLIENVYTLKIMNKMQQDAEFSISAGGLEGISIIGQQQVNIASGEVLTLPVSVTVDAYALEERVTDIEFTIRALGTDYVVTEPTRFLYK